jgi:hypothetical protein
MTRVNLNLAFVRSLWTSMLRKKLSFVDSLTRLMNCFDLSIGDTRKAVRVDGSDCLLDILDYICVCVSERERTVADSRDKYVLFSC